MKRPITFALSFILLATAAGSCKKGEDDPAFSLLSRKARVAGEWTVTSMEETRKTVYDDPGHSSLQSTTHNGTTITITAAETENGNTVTGTSSAAGSLTYVFEKDGTYEFVHIYDGTTSTETGNWSFIGKNKGADMKNKEAIMLVRKTIIFPNGISNFDQNSGNVLLLRKLKNNEMVWTTNNSSAYPGQSTQSESTVSLTRN